MKDALGLILLDILIFCSACIILQFCRKPVKQIVRGDSGNKAIPVNMELLWKNSQPFSDGLFSSKACLFQLGACPKEDRLSCVIM